jgi:hypothetical protein
MDDANKLDVLIERVNALENTVRDLTEIIQKLSPVVDIMGRVLIRRHTVNERLGFSKDTLSKSRKITKFQPIGERKVFVQIGELSFVRQYKRTKKSVKVRNIKE